MIIDVSICKIDFLQIRTLSKTREIPNAAKINKIYTNKMKGTYDFQVGFLSESMSEAQEKS